MNSTTQNTGSSQTWALAPSSILSHAAKCLGTDDTTVRNPYEAVALIGHACMTAVGFRLIGLDEDHNIDPEKTSSSVLPKEWNANSTYSFKYAHQQSSMQYLLKISRLGSKAVIFALALGDDRTASFDVPTKDYVSESALPLSADSRENFSDRLSQIFVSSTRVGDLISLFKVNVIQRLAPGLQKEGYEDTSQQTRQASRQLEQRDERQPARDPLRDDRMPQPARPYPFNDPLAVPPRNPMPTGDFLPPRFEDEFEINAPPRGYHPGYGERRPLNIGERDLYPPGIAPHDPLRGHFGPQRGGGGMHPTFDDPMFGGMGGGGQEYIPRVPAGARYDPVGPDDNQPSGRGGRPNVRGGFGGPRGGFGGPGGFGGFGGFGGDII